ncbi:MAG TPA: hypothetical protein VN524_17150, partial [Hyphomicrobiaceae bacterium]|nr:hypothetical protein [Hyphomicrobiaceae bacterium]
MPPAGIACCGAAKWVFSRTIDGIAKIILGVATDLTSEVRRKREIDGLRKQILKIRDDERRRIAL